MPTAPINLYAPYKERIHDALYNKNLKTVLNRTVGRMSASRVAAMGAVDGEQLRRQVRQMKEYVLRNLPDLLEQFEANVEANGGHVHWAQDAADANRILLDLARRHAVQKVVKSKSMVTEEICLNDALEGAGVKVVETDLGEYIIQLAGEPPSHIVAPAAHKRIEDIAAVMQEKLDMPPTLDAEVMCSAARASLRREFLSADMGVSGCNFAIAETGTVCIATNEGNGRMVASLPRVYVAVMGIEKLVPSVEDAFLQLQALSRSSTGQQVTVYLSMTSGPRQPLDVDGPEEFHVVLLDNGRSEMLARGYGEALMCIRCGACLNICPVYREIGGHAYGSTYSGPIGSVISPMLAVEASEPEKLPYASSLCGACRDACPVMIDLPRLLLDLRHYYVQQGAPSWLERQAMQGFLKMMQSRKLYEAGGKMGSLGSNLLASFNGGAITHMPPPFSAWTKTRHFPPLARKSFRELWAERMERRKSISGREPGEG